MIDEEQYFGRNLKSWISIQSINYNSITLRYSVDINFSLPIVIKVNSNNKLLFENSYFEHIAQIKIDNLIAKSNYEIVVSAEKESITLKAQTLEMPSTKKILKLLFLADMHLSLSDKNAYGRLHLSSAMFFKNYLEYAKNNQFDMIVFPGDMVDKGSVQEFKLLDEILSYNQIPILCTAGNHDIVPNNKIDFVKRFGSGATFFEKNNLQFASFDTSDGKFDKECNLNIIEQINVNKPIIATTHYQLYPDSWIADSDKIINDQVLIEKYLHKLSQCHGVLYVGHKNVASLTKTNNLYQLNLPQLTHFPAGALVATVYENGIWHNFLPIADEKMNELSRIETEQAVYHSHHECYLKSTYRDKNTQHHWNKVLYI